MDKESHEALVIKPGDVLVLRYERALTQQEIDNLTETTRAEIPEGVSIMVIDQCAQMAVIRS